MFYTRGSSFRIMSLLIFSEESQVVDRQDGKTDSKQADCDGSEIVAEELAEHPAGVGNDPDAYCEVVKGF